MSKANYACCNKCGKKLVYVGEDDSPIVYCDDCFKLSPWIRITPATMPEKGVRVFATDGKTIREMERCGDVLSFSGSHSFDDHVTHWMPKPTLPEN